MDADGGGREERPSVEGERSVGGREDLARGSS